MGSNSSTVQYLIPLPQSYQKGDQSGIYQFKYLHQQNQSSFNNDRHSHQNADPEINLGSNENQVQQSQIREVNIQKDNNRLNLSVQQKVDVSDNANPHTQTKYPYLKHYSIILNKFQTQSYLNHLLYRNQPQFKQLIIQIPYGNVQKHSKYTKLNLYSQQIFVTLNQLSHLPFLDMAKILYNSLLAYMYLYSYFGMFKIQENMIGFLRNGKVKVWINHNITKDRPLPIISDVNLKRFKEEESYMVDDLLTIFYNKVDKQTVPVNFTLISNITKIKASRMTSSRLALSRVSSDQALEQSMMSSLQTNLIQDFSDGSFQRCLQYLQNYFNWKRPQFKKNINQNQKLEEGKLQKPIFQNFIPCIIDVVNSKTKAITQSRVSTNITRTNLCINVKQLILKSNPNIFRHHNIPSNSVINQITMIPNQFQNKINFNYNSNIVPQNLNRSSQTMIYSSPNLIPPNNQIHQTHYIPNNNLSFLRNIQKQQKFSNSIGKDQRINSSANYNPPKIVFNSNINNIKNNQVNDISFSKNSHNQIFVTDTRNQNTQINNSQFQNNVVLTNQNQNMMNQNLINREVISSTSIEYEHKQNMASSQVTPVNFDKDNQALNNSLSLDARYRSNSIIDGVIV